MPKVKQRSGDDWADEVRRLHRMRVAADLDVEAGVRSEAWGDLVRASSDALSLLLVTSQDGETQALMGARERLNQALRKAAA